MTLDDFNIYKVQKFRVFNGALLLLCFIPPCSYAIDLRLLAQPKVWSGVSEIIGYRQKIWFVNSEKFRNHNSADIYTYDLKTKRTNYQRSLFSQDAGDPVVADGLLYWPYEDSRFSAGRGEYMVTNGEEWGVNMLPQGQVFHIHTIIKHNQTLYAAPSAWRAGIQRSLDHGLKWEILYDHDTPTRRVSRITSLAFHKGILYAGLTAYYQTGKRLLKFQNDQSSTVKDWPQGQSVRKLISFGDWLYAVNRDEGSTKLWRTNGNEAKQINALNGFRLQDFAVGRNKLWAVVAAEGKGKILSSVNGVDWLTEYRFDNSAPIDITSYMDQIFVGTINHQGGGELWGERVGLSDFALSSSNSKTAEIIRPNRFLKGAKLKAALENLDRVVQDDSSYHSGISTVRNAIHPIAYQGAEQAGIELSNRLRNRFPEIQLSLIGGNAKPTAEQAVYWYLLRAIGFIGKGHVPPKWLMSPWDRPDNMAEKYFHLTPAAAWTVAQIGQNDRGTIQALIQRLDNKDDPKWLRSDIVSALTILTGEKFEFDIDGWLHWWEKYQNDFR